MTTLTSAGGETFPSTVIATTGSYTVPSGSFAIIRANSRAATSLTINGTTVLYTDSLSWSTQRVSSTPYKITSGTFTNGQIVNSSSSWGSTTPMYSNSTAYNRPSVFGFYKVPSGTVIGGNCYKLIEVY